MDKLKTIGALITAALAFCSALFPLIGYVPPVPIDKLLHLTPEQIGLGLALVSNFLRPLHQLVPEVWAMATAILQRDNSRADEAFALVMNRMATIEQMLAQQQAQAQAPAPVPLAQAGRMSLHGMLAAASLACVGFLGATAFSGCTTTQTARIDSDLQRVQVVLAQACPTMQATVITLGVLELSPDGAAALAVAKQAIDGACAVGTGATQANVQALANAALPQLDAAMKASSLSDDEKRKVIVDLGVANALVNSFLNAAKPPVAPASAASASL